MDCRRRCGEQPAHQEVAGALPRLKGHLSFADALPRHGVNDVVYTQADGEVGIGRGVIGIVGVFPGVADVGVVRDGDQDAAPVIVDAAPVRALTVFRALGILRAFIALADMCLAGDLEALLQVVDGVEDGIVVGDVADFAVGEC